MTQMIGAGESSGVSTVSVWTPWGEQKVQKAERAALLQRAATRLRASNELPAVPDFSATAWNAA